MYKYKVTFDKGCPNVMDSRRTTNRCEMCHKDIYFFQRAYCVEEQASHDWADQWNNVAWSPKLGTFTATSSKSNNITTSLDGINWTDTASWWLVCSKICADMFILSQI